MLAAQLADEWVKIIRALAIADGGPNYGGAVRKFAAFMDEYAPTLGLDPADARLESDVIDLVAATYAWEDALRRDFPHSKHAKNLVRALLALIDQRASAGGTVCENLRIRAQAPTAFRAPRDKPLDEFTNAERIDLRDAAREQVRVTETRLARGRNLLAAGEDPRNGGWRSLPNLLWAARAGMVTSKVLQKELPSKSKWWPSEIREILPDWTDGDTTRRPGVRSLIRSLGRMLFADEMDLHAFRILLLLGMSDTTPEELHDLQIPDIEFTDGGVRLIQQKNRATRIRADLHPEQPAPQQQDSYFAGAGTWDVHGLLRRLLAATALARDAFTSEPWLFLAVDYRQAARGLGAECAGFTHDQRRFTHWIAAQRDSGGNLLAISQPHDVRRLRKTTKVVRAVVLGGSVSDLAGDDHHVEIYRGHYAHGTTAHVLAGRAINRSQQWVFQRATQKPVLVDAAAEPRLEEPEVAEPLGLDSSQVKAIRAGELDMGITHCRNPYDSPHRSDGRVCHVAPAMCMLCRNAVIFTSQLPRLLMLSDHIERMRAALPPPQWQAVWGRQAAALKEVFTECADLLPAARQQVVDLRLRLDLPLGQRTEFDR
ncbi:hypothetical protein AB0K71_22220 [Streptomyces syringium]|uniref:hypothetical protein n=1 Tax=Streptomyces syringium TaxID=76729 RepID=UPI00344AF9EA